MGNIGANNIDEKINYDICSNQGAIFENAAGKGYELEKFSELYMNSSFCNSAYDKPWSLFHYAQPKECLGEVISEFGSKLVQRTDDKIFNPDIAYWIGFVYRQLCIETGKSSKQMADLVPFDELCMAYPGLHTIDEQKATDMICKKHGLLKK